MTIGQAALKWLLASPVVMTTLPNIYNVEQLEEFAAASDLPDLTADDLRRIEELQRTNFGVHEDHMRYKGTMVRDGEPLGPVYRYAGDGFPGAPQAVERPPRTELTATGSRGWPTAPASASPGPLFRIGDHALAMSPLGVGHARPAAPPRGRFRHPAGSLGARHPAASASRRCRTASHSWSSS